MIANDFVIDSIQISIFTPQILFNKNNILELLIKNYSSLFDAGPISIPLPPNAPEEIPVIILQSIDMKFKLEIAKNRISIYRVNREEGNLDFRSDFHKKSVELFSQYKDISKAVFGRLGVVTTRYLKIENPGLSLVKYFCKEDKIAGPLKCPENFEIHAHKKYPLQKTFNINSWVRCRTGELLKDRSKVVIVNQDINTLAEEMSTKNYSSEEVKNYISIVFNEQDDILKLYFPEG